MMENERKGLFSSFTLKMIAIFTMVIDHIGYICIPQDTFWHVACRAVGRIAFPIFCFLLVEGFFRTRSHVNYLIRLCIFAILSEIPFDLAFHNTLLEFGYQNVFITLALGLLSLFCIEERNNQPFFTIPLILIWVVAYFVHCDYGLGGVLLIDLFYYTRKMPTYRVLLVALLMFLCFGPLELFGLLAMPLIQLYNGKKGPSVKMFFYWFYPAHLLILYFVSQLPKRF